MAHEGEEVKKQFDGCSIKNLGNNTVYHITMSVYNNIVDIYDSGVLVSIVV